MPDSKWAALCRRKVAAREAEYCPPFGMEETCSRMSRLKGPGARCAKQGAAPRKSPRVAMIRVRVPLKTTPSQINSIGSAATWESTKLQTSKRSAAMRWSLEFGASLELGAWSLELFPCLAL